MSHFAVIDTETTGLSPAHHHRIVEIAVVVLDDRGKVVREWATLVNPERDVTAGEIHGLAGADVYAAPTFKQIAGDLEGLLRGNVPFAHNLAFDAAFLAAEYDRLGHPIPLGPATGLCTLRLSARYLYSGSRTLEACCDCIGHRLESAHSALHDARAAASLLVHFLSVDRKFCRRWSDEIRAAERFPWPGLPPRRVQCVPRASVEGPSRDHFLSRLVSRSTRREITPDAESYLAVLDKALLDRQLSRHEEDELIAVARMIGLSREDAMVLHRSYLACLGRLALADGIVTDEERDDLNAVARMLGLGSAAVERALSGSEDVPDFEVGGFNLKPGDAIVFTGEALGMEREELTSQARALGLKVRSMVSRKTTLLVAADPDSLSGKARKAREVGVPIVDYETYRKMIGSLR